MTTVDAVFSAPPGTVPAYGQLVELGHLCLSFGEVQRGTFHPDGKTRESDTTHTVMLTVVACSLADRYYSDLDRGLIAQFASVHDVQEVYAGDTHTLRLLGADARRSKELREAEARLRIAKQFPDLPWLARLIAMYEDQDTPEAQFVWAVDKLLPKITCMFNDGPGLTDPDVTAGELRARLAHQGREIRARAPRFEVLHHLHDEVCAFVVRQLADWHAGRAEAGQ